MNLKSKLKSTQGVLLKPNITNKSKTNKERRKRLHEHLRTDIHLWCAQNDKDNLKSEEVNQEKNMQAARLVVTSAIQSLLEVDGSLQFIRLNNMLETLFGEGYPTKNDGREMFFEIREIAFKKLSEKIQTNFKSVDNACFSLDKVTVGRTSFTVIMSYFFSGGKIHVLLNSVHKMKVEEYDRPGSARMVGEVLMASLGLTKEEVGKKFRHATYDGVYASREERIAGGGCLSLMNNFADWCGTSPDSVTGHWDVGHRLQLVYCDVLKKSHDMKKFLRVVDSARSYCHGKDGILLHDLAYELKASHLTDKSEQTTRWVKSLLRLIEAFFRNLPTICKMIGGLMEAAHKNDDRTEHKSLQSTYNFISDPYYLSFGIGLSQILDSFAKVSLESQRLWNFPGTIVMAVHTLQQNTGSTFIWNRDPLSLGGIGSPLIHVENLMEGMFKQQLTEGMRRSAAVSLNQYKKTDYDFDLIDQPLTSKDIEEQQVSVAALTSEEKLKVEKALSELSNNVRKGLDSRLTMSPMMIACMNAFNKTEWFEPDDGNVRSKAEEKVKDLIKELGPNDLKIETLIPGYISFLEFKTTYLALRVEDVYSMFFRSKSTDVDIAPFLSFFEFINIKSFSEAYCESVGSLMNILVNKGRNLCAGNFSKELIFSFNSPPLHILSKQFITEIAETLINDKRKDFFRCLDTNNKFRYKLKFVTISASLGNFRSDSDRNSHLPVEFFL